MFISILMGSVGAFLYFNIYKARIWLGDVGSMALGASLGIIGLLTGKIIAVAFIGGVFVLEAGSSLLQILSKNSSEKSISCISASSLFTTTWMGGAKNCHACLVTWISLCYYWSILRFHRLINVFIYLK